MGEPVVTLTSEIADHFNMNIDPDLYWSESSWFSWHIPERRINGFFYNHFRPNMNCMLAGPAMWDDTTPHAWDFLFYDWQAMRPLPRGRYGVDYDKYDFETDFSFSIRTLEPLKRYKLGYDANGFKLDLTFEAIAEPHEVGRRHDHGFDGAYRLHFEQPGRITGAVELDGEMYEVDSLSIRDGSHGRRNLEKCTPGGYQWSTADARTGWHIMAVDANDSRDTVAVGGYILRDGVIASIAQGTRRVVEREGPRPSVVEVIATDTLGRELHAIGRSVCAAEVILFPDRGMWWQQFAWDYDGFIGAVGEDQEYYGLQDYRNWHRAGPDAWARR
jgi:hypothetical protein